MHDAPLFNLNESCQGISLEMQKKKKKKGIQYSVMKFGKGALYLLSLPPLPLPEINTGGGDGMFPYFPPN